MTQARAANPWLAAGSQAVQQQASRDLDQAWRNFFGATHARPTWRKRGRHEGLRIVGLDRGVAVALAVSDATMTSPAGLRPEEAERLLRLQRRLARARKGSNRRGTLAAPGRTGPHRAAPGRGVRQKAGLNRGLLAAGWSRESRESQAVFRCVACGHSDNADVNAARNIRDREPTAVGRTVAARGDRVQSARSVKREPQRARPPQVA